MRSILENRLNSKSRLRLSPESILRLSLRRNWLMLLRKLLRSILRLSLRRDWLTLLRKLLRLNN
jgi:hypothetical protein